MIPRNINKVTWENGYCESFKARLRDKLLNDEIFCQLREAQIIIQKWRRYYNIKKPHSASGSQPPAKPSYPWIRGQ